MNLSAPKNTTFYIAVVLGLLGLLGFLIPIPFVTDFAFWFVFVAFLLLGAAALLPNL
jgi:hypothetical protein